MGNYCSPCDESIFWLVMSTVILISIIGFFANIIVIIALSRIKRSSANSNTNLFLICLAISDLLVIIYKVPWFIVYESDNVPFNDIWCKISPTVLLPPLMSCWLMFLIALDRYMIIIYPLKQIMSRHLAIMSIIIVFCAGIIIISPVMYIIESLNMHDVFVSCLEFWPASVFEISYSVFLFIVQFILPLTMTGILYGSISRSLARRNRLKISKKSQTPTSDIQTNETNQQSKNTNNTFYSSNTTKNSRKSVNRRPLRTNRILISIVACFTISWAPFMIFRLCHVVLVPTSIIAYQINNNKTSNLASIKAIKYSREMNYIVQIFSILSTCINPFFYGWLNESVKNSIKRNLSCCNCRRMTNSSTKFNTEENHDISLKLDKLDKCNIGEGITSENFNEIQLSHDKQTENIDLYTDDQKYPESESATGSASIQSLRGNQMLFKARAFPSKFYKKPPNEDSKLSFSRNTSLVTFSTGIMQNDS